MCTGVNACDFTRGCTDTVLESALKADSGRKIPCRTRQSNLHRQRAGQMLYQRNYIPSSAHYVLDTCPVRFTLCIVATCPKKIMRSMLCVTRLCMLGRLLTLHLFAIALKCESSECNCSSCYSLKNNFVKFPSTICKGDFTHFADNNFF